MSKEFVPYEEALALKELGFDEYCLADYRQWDGRGEYLHLNEDYSQTHYTVECKAPLYQQAFRWFREKYDLSHSIVEHEHRYSYSTNCGDFKIIGSYEEAELYCLKKLIEIVNQNKYEVIY
mgnify:CR=1 FL=1